MKKIVFALWLSMLLTSCIWNSVITSNSNNKEIPVIEITDEQEKELLKKNTLSESEILQLKNKKNKVFIKTDNWKIDIKIDDIKITNEEASNLGIQ